MRPKGEVHQAVLGVAWEVARERAKSPVPGVTWRDAAARLVPKGVARHLVRATWKNLAARGQLRPVGEVRVPDSARPLVAYAPVEPGGASARGAASCTDLALRAVMHGWLGG